MDSKYKILAVLAQRTAVVVALAMAGSLINTCTATAECPNSAARAALSSELLSDCRAYELVSATSKYGQPVNTGNIASNGERVTASSIGSFSGSNQTSPLNYYDFIRTVDGWKAMPLNTPAGWFDPVATDVSAMNPNLDQGLFEYLRTPVVDTRERHLYIHRLPESEPLEVGPIFSPAALKANPPLEVSVSTPSVSSDLNHIVFMMEGPNTVQGPLLNYTWPGDTTEVNSGEGSSGQGFISLYEYVGIHSPEPMLVGTDGAGHLISQCGTSLGFPAEGLFTKLQGDELYNAISTEGSRSRIVFTVAAGPCGKEGKGPEVNDLFVKEEEPSGVSHTINISEPTSGKGGDCEECNTSKELSGAVYQGSSEDGSKVFFLSHQPLLGGSDGTNLFEYSFAPDARGRRVKIVAHDVEGVSRISEDGSHAYFVSTAKLVSQPNAMGNIPEIGADNLYLYEQDINYPSGHVVFVATLSPADNRDWAREDLRPVDATPDGVHLVFISKASLTNDGAVGTAQVFEYNAQNERLVRVSRAEQGFSSADGEGYDASIAYPNYEGSHDAAGQPTSVSEDGGTVVFQSAASLIPHAVPGYPNVYEYRNGRLSLISDGQDHSFFAEGAVPTTRLIGMDGSATDIFFTSADQLVPQDGDTQEDIYDARVGGGFVENALPACEGDGCQGSLTSSPRSSLVGSITQTAGEQAAVESSPKSKVRAKKKATKKKVVKRRKARRARRAHVGHYKGRP